MGFTNATIACLVPFVVDIENLLSSTYNASIDQTKDVTNNNNVTKVEDDAVVPVQSTSSEVTRDIRRTSLMMKFNIIGFMKGIDYGRLYGSINETTKTRISEILIAIVTRIAVIAINSVDLIFKSLLFWTAGKTF